MDAPSAAKTPLLASLAAAWKGGRVSDDGDSDVVSLAPPPLDDEGEGEGEGGMKARGTSSR